MTRPRALIDRDTWPPFLGLLFFTGTALILSIPGSSAVRDLEQVQHFAHTVGFDITRLFVDVYVLGFGLLGLRLGSVSAERRERRWREGPRLVLRVLLGQVLCLPYLLLFRALHPGRDGGLALVALFATVFASLGALLHWRAEEPSETSTRSFTSYAVYFGVAFLPLAGAPFLSPLGAGRVLLAGSGAARAFVAFVAPVALFAAALTLARWLRGLAHG